MKYWFISITAIMLLGACSKSNKFHITGAITSAADSMLYLENVGIDGITRLDSTRLDANGEFNFAQQGVSSPEFYRLRIDKQIINLAIDSTETVTVNADYPSMARDYSVSGSHDCEKMRELARHQMHLQATINNIIRDPQRRVADIQPAIDSELERYKTMIKNDYIYQEPGAAYAYFALFQTVALGYNLSLIFNPRNSEEDIKAFAAVATSWDLNHKGSLRAEQLHNIAINGMKNVRIVRAQNEQVIEAEKVNDSGIIDIALPDNKGVTRKLSDMKGKVVLLDFCAFAQEGTNDRMMAMREIYDKYHSRGLEIYQVSVDSDEHFWLTRCAALPWTCVRDPQGIASMNIMRYNVYALPTYFLLDRNCQPAKRDEQIADVEKEIERLL